MYPKVTLSKSMLNKEIKTTKFSKSYEANDFVTLSTLSNPSQKLIKLFW